MTESVLFVCAQNICRSPLMAAAFQEALRAEGELGLGASEWAVESVGTVASEGRRACRVSVEIVPAAADHHSVRLEAEDLDVADLVIAASLEERSLIARLRPQARSRAFTLREALLLGEQRITASSLAEYAAVLDSRRGTLDLPTPSSLPWRSADDPLDVVDVHQLGTRAHRKGLEKAAADTRLLAARLRRDLAPAT
ncbi:arsenate reductase/protein-tyrosine-phosphatase family protein [Microbacterium maritypicum]